MDSPDSQESVENRCVHHNHCGLSSQVGGWVVGWLFGLLVGWFVGCLVGWLVIKLHFNVPHIFFRFINHSSQARNTIKATQSKLYTGILYTTITISQTILSF